MVNNREIYLKKIRLYSFEYLIFYLIIRWNVFIIEDKRKIFTEFTYRDFLAQHYIFIKNDQKIGIIRLIFKGDMASISRVAIIKKYRSQGYAKELMHQVVLLINNRKIKQIKLYSSTKLIKFYENFGFIAGEKSYYNNILYTRMIKTI